MTNKERLKKMCEYIFEHEMESYVEYLEIQPLTNEEDKILNSLDFKSYSSSGFLEAMANKYDHDHIWALASRVYDGILQGMED